MPDEDTVELGVMARLPSPPPSRSGDAAPPLRIRSRSAEDPGCCPRLSGKHALGGAQIGASVSIDTRAHCSWEAPRRSRWWEETATPHAAGKPTSDRDEGFRAGWGRHVAARGNKAARAGGGSGGCATTGEVALKGQAGDEAFRSRRKVSAPYVVSMLPPEAFRRRRAYKLLQDEPVGMYMYVWPETLRRRLSAPGGIVADHQPSRELFAGSASLVQRAGKGCRRDAGPRRPAPEALAAHHHPVPPSPPLPPGILVRAAAQLSTPSRHPPLPPPAPAAGWCCSSRLGSSW